MKLHAIFLVSALTLVASNCGAQAAAPAKPLTQDQKDAAHLLQLATELKATMDATKGFEVSVKFLRLADEVETLARTLRTRTSTAQPAPPQRPPADKAPQK